MKYIICIIMILSCANAAMSAAPVTTTPPPKEAQESFIDKAGKTLPSAPDAIHQAAPSIPTPPEIAKIETATEAHPASPAPIAAPAITPQTVAPAQAIKPPSDLSLPKLPPIKEEVKPTTHISEKKSAYSFTIAIPKFIMDFLPKPAAKKIQEAPVAPKPTPVIHEAPKPTPTPPLAPTPTRQSAPSIIKKPIVTLDAKQPASPAPTAVAPAPIPQTKPAMVTPVATPQPSSTVPAAPVAQPAPTTVVTPAPISTPAPKPTPVPTTQPAPKPTSTPPLVLTKPAPALAPPAHTAPPVQITPHVAITPQKQALISKPVDKELEQFIEDESKMLDEMEDDVILGRVTDEAKFQHMGYSQYLSLYQKYRDYITNMPAFNANESFIAGRRKIDGDTLPNMSDGYLFITALGYIQSNKLDELRVLANNYKLLQLTNKHGDSLLHFAATANNVYLTKWLIMRGINVNAMNDDAITAKDIAEYEQYWGVFNLLDAANAK